MTSHRFCVNFYISFYNICIHRLLSFIYFVQVATYIVFFLGYNLFASLNAWFQNFLPQEKWQLSEGWVPFWARSLNFSSFSCFFASFSAWYTVDSTSLGKDVDPHCEWQHSTTDNLWRKKSKGQSLSTLFWSNNMFFPHWFC